MVVRRLLIALALLLLLVAIAAGVSPPPREDPADGPGSASVLPAGEEVERTLPIDAAGSDRVVKVAVGDTLRLTVEGDAVDSVALGEFKVEPLDPTSPAIFDLLAELPGTYPIRLLEADREIGTLEIEE